MWQRSKDVCEIVSRKDLSGTATVSMTVNHDVVGSSPTWGAITDRVIDTIYQLLYRFFMPENPCFKPFF